MSRERWQKVDRLFKSALERAPAERADFLAQACAGDEELREEVESLVLHDDASDFLKSQAFDEAARVLASEKAAALVGQTLGGYKVLEKIGAGGMGEVYRALQLRTGRRVALKLLPGHFTGDEQRVRRFQLEARAVLALNHPNIVTVYDIEQADGAHLIASELIEGETLRRRMSRAPLGVVEALDVAAQVAAALAAAHEAGVVHRDIKPENVMLRPDGYVKVLDFGLAKLTDRRPEAAESGLPTLALVDTGPGVVMGTVSYMSPEQARGQEVDARTDVWSLGVVLYEMLAGEPPFKGQTGSDVMASILQKEPAPLSRLRADAPESLEWLVTKALTKEKEGRYQTAKELGADLKRLRRRLELKAESEGSGGHAPTTAGAVSPAAGPPTAPERKAVTTAEEPRAVSSAEYIFGRVGRHKRAVALVAALLFAGLAGAGYGLYKLWPSSRNAPDFRALNISQLADTGQASDAAVSPDGEFVVYVKEESGRQSLWLRQTSATSSVQIVAPAEGQRIASPAFSPDGAFIYYLKAPPRVTRATLYRIPKLGAAAEAKLVEDISLQDTRNNFGLSPDGKQVSFIRLDEGYNRSLMVADQDGGNARVLHSVQTPQFLSGAAWSPDGKTIACVMGTFVGRKTVLAVRVAGGGVERFTERHWNHASALAWLHDSSGLVLVAAEKGDHYQLWRLSYPGGEARRITNDVTSYFSVSVANDSSLLAAVQANTVLNIWTAAPSKGGAETEARQLTFGAGRYDGQRGLAWTPDGRIIYHSLASGNPDLWVINADGTGQKQLTDGAGQNFFPSVSPDGRYVVFTSDREGKDGNFDLWRMDIDGSNAKMLARDGARPSISPDGRWVFFYQSGAGGLWKVPIEGGERVKVPQSERDLVATPVVSPDGRLIACNYLVAGPNALFRIGVLPAEGGAPLKIFDVPGAPIRTLRWTPDSRGVTYVDTRLGVSNLVRQPLEGGPPAPFTNFKADTIDHFDWSPDGRRLALSRGNSTSNVVLIRDFK